MRLTKVFSIIVFLNLFALLLTYQQTEIIKFSYKNKEQKDHLQEVLDYHNRLKFTIEHCKSLENIDNRLFAQAENFQLPNQSQIMMLRASAPSSGQGVIAKASKGERNIFSKAFFWLEREVQAEANAEANE